MKYIISILLVSVGINLLAQPPQPTLNWVKTMGNTDVDQVRSMVPTSDGGFIAISEVYFPSSGDFIKPTGHSSYEFCAIRFDSTKSVVWKQCYGGSGQDRPFKIITLRNGSFLIGGDTESNDGDVTHKRMGGTNAWLLCIDGNGGKLWDSTYGSAVGVGFSDVIETLDGGYMLCIVGNQGNGDLDSVYGGNGGLYDAHLLKLDSTGTKEWVRNIGGTGDEGAMKVVQHPDSSYYITLYNESLDIDCTPSGFSLNGFPNPADNPSRDMYVAKLDKNGTMLWHYDYGGTLFDEINPGGGILLADDTCLFVVGNTRSNDYMASSNHSGSLSNPITDILVLKIDTSGKLLWSRCIGGSYDDECFSIASNGSGGILLAGTSQSWDGDVPRSFDSSGINDAYIANVDTNGDLIWGGSIIGQWNDVLVSGCVLSDKHRILVGGFTATQGPSGDIPGPYKGNGDMLFAEFSLWPSSSNYITKEEDFMIYPNPASTKVYVRGVLNDNDIISLQDINGKQLKVLSKKEAFHGISLREYPAGFYLLSIRTNKTIIYKKLIIQS